MPASCWIPSIHENVFNCRGALHWRQRFVCRASLINPRQWLVKRLTLRSEIHYANGNDDGFLSITTSKKDLHISTKLPYQTPEPFLSMQLHFFLHFNSFRRLQTMIWRPLEWVVLDVGFVVMAADETKKVILFNSRRVLRAWRSWSDLTDIRQIEV